MSKDGATRSPRVEVVCLLGVALPRPLAHPKRDWSPFQPYKATTSKPPSATSAIHPKIQNPKTQAQLDINGLHFNGRYSRRAFVERKEEKS